MGKKSEWLILNRPHPLVHPLTRHPRHPVRTVPGTLGSIARITLCETLVTGHPMHPHTHPGTWNNVYKSTLVTRCTKRKRSQSPTAPACSRGGGGKGLATTDCAAVHTSGVLLTPGCSLACFTVSYETVPVQQGTVLPWPWAISSPGAASQRV